MLALDLSYISKTRVLVDAIRTVQSPFTAAAPFLLKIYCMPVNALKLIQKLIDMGVSEEPSENDKVSPLATVKVSESFLEPAL